MKMRIHIALGMLSSGILILFLIGIGVKTELLIGDLMLIGGIFAVLPDLDIFIKKHRMGLHTLYWHRL